MTTSILKKTLTQITLELRQGLSREELIELILRIDDGEMDYKFTWDVLASLKQQAKEYDNLTEKDLTKNIKSGNIVKL